MEKNNFKCVFANDIVQSSGKIYQLNNYPDVFKLGDLNEIQVKDIPKHNILCGGFPCQPFSIAGKQQGFKDNRSNVFWKILEILEYHKPNIIILENVKNLTSHDKGNTYQIIYNELTKLGYMIKSKVLDTSKITKLPQHRERIYIIGFLDKDMYDKFNLDFSIIDNNKIIDYLENDVPDKYYYKEKLKVYNEVKK